MTADDRLILRVTDPAEWVAWLAAHHDRIGEVWLAIPHKGVAGPSWEEAVIGALIWGWVDSVRAKGGPDHALQRFSPRKKGSTWSQKNCANAERLIAEGRMQPPGLRAVEAARTNGRWDAAYSGQAEMVVPEDFLAALEAGPEAARVMYATLNRTNLFAIYHRLTIAKRPEIRAKRITDYVAMLARGEKFH